MSSALIVNQKEKIRDLIESSDSIGIVVSENQDIDSVGAALGLYLILVAAGKKVQIVSKKNPEVSVSNLVGVDKISKSFSGTTKILTISVPYREGEIEKVSYNIEDTRLNVNLFAESSGITFNESDVQYIRKGSAPSTIITVGIANEAELGGLVDLTGVKTIHLDKNPMNSMFGDASIIDPSFSSLSEIAAQIIIELNLGYDPDALQNLLDGMIYATDNFTSQNTSPYAFEAAGFLLANGAKRKDRSFESLHDRQDRLQTSTDDRFPKEEHLLRQGRSPLRQGARDTRLTNPNPANSNSVGQISHNDPDAQVFAGGPARNAPARHASQVDAGGQSQNPLPAKNIEEAESIEGSSEAAVPDDWFLPKVFKGTRKGN
jgi:hypothetical protein